MGLMVKAYTKYRETQKREHDAYESAKQKVGSLRRFYKHVTIYILVNLVISFRGIFNTMGDGVNFKNAVSDGDVYTLWIVWGFILCIHGMNVFAKINIFGQKWEERKIQQYMNEEIRN